MAADKEIWQRIYDEEGTPWDLDGATPALSEMLEAGAEWGLGTGVTIAVPGCGLGHDAAALAARGFRVRAIDPVPAALEAARARYGLAVDWAERDWLAERPGAFDALFDHAFFVAFEPRRRVEVVAAHARQLKPGGLWMGLFWHTVKEVDAAPPWAVQPAELAALAEPFFDILSLEAARNSHPRRAGREFWMIAKRS